MNGKKFIVQAKRSDLQRDDITSHKNNSLTPKIYVIVCLCLYLCLCKEKKKKREKETEQRKH